MFKRIIASFRKPAIEEKPREIEISKIDKHMNFILRDRLGSLNKSITEKIYQINDIKEDIVHELRILHKKELMNPNIPQREIQIMEGNREHYIKRLSHFVTNIDMPKNYLETYDYCIKFSTELASLYKELQKNIMVLGNFFGNEIKTINKGLHDLEEIMVDLRITFENNNISVLKQVQDNIARLSSYAANIKDIETTIEDNRSIIAQHSEKLKKLNERVATIMSGSEFKTLETFKEEKEDAEAKIKENFKPLDEIFSELDSALKKQYHKNSDKLLRQYLDDRYNAFMNDANLDITVIFEILKSGLASNEIILKDKKKDHTLKALSKMSADRLRTLQEELKKLDEQRRNAQTRITHNSASLNMSEQQYWINNTKEKIDHYNAEIDKMNKDIERIRQSIRDTLGSIRTGIEKILSEKIILIDDLDSQESS